MAISRYLYLVWTVPLIGGCARAGNSPPSVPEPTRISAVAERYDLCAADRSACTWTSQTMSMSQRDTRGGPEILLTGSIASAPAVSKRSGFGTARVLQAVETQLSGAKPPTAPTPTPTANATERGSRARQLIDWEAHLALEVPEPRDAAARARALTATAGGEVVNEVFEDTESRSGSALSIRVPSERALWLVERLSALGHVRSSKSQASDVTRKVGDAEIVLRNLESALERYRELLKTAETANEMVAIEKELERVLTAIDRVKADLATMTDRVARSTLYLQLMLPQQERVSKDAKLRLGLRAPYVFDIDPDDDGSSFIGGGLSFLFSRTLNLDLDLLTNAHRGRSDGIDLLLATLGVELYSNLLGAGQRRSFNPYFGFRAGYANLAGDAAAALGGSLGLELYKSELVLWDVQARTYALVGTPDGTHVLLQPAMTFSVAY